MARPPSLHQPSHPAPCPPGWISYLQGESEELLLDSVIKEGHMSLIQQ